MQLESCGRRHSILDVWRIGTRSVDLMLSRDSVLSMLSTDMASRKRICDILIVIDTLNESRLLSKYVNSMSISKIDGSFS